MNIENIITGNAKVVRNINRAMILNIIRTNQPVSRSEIARMLGLNKSTVSSIVNDLLEEEIIYEQMKADQNIGRNPLDLYLKLGKYRVGAVNIDSSITSFAIVDIDGSLVCSSKIKTEEKEPEIFIGRCLDEIKSLCSRYKVDYLEGLGISISGIVDSRKLSVNFAPNLDWEDIPIGEIIQNRWPELKILAIGNDAKCSAMAELWFGKHELNFSNFVFVSVGTGIGAGIVIDNRILDGESQASGEFGHMTIYEGGERCVCGNHGCWEAYASDRATVKRYNERKNIPSVMRPIDLMMDDIIRLAEKKDKLSVEILTQTGYYLGLGITNIIRAIDPKAIILDGRIIKVWDIIYPEIIQVVKKRAFFGKRREIMILPTSLKIRPRLLGAATLAIKEIFDDYKIMI